MQRAYKGETTALARLRIGYTTAELKGRKFEDVIKDLQERFDGAAGKATDTFAGKMARLSAAVEQAKEAFGEGLVGGLEDADIAFVTFKLPNVLTNTPTPLPNASCISVKVADAVVSLPKFNRD